MSRRHYEDPDCPVEDLAEASLGLFGDFRMVDQPLDPELAERLIERVTFWHGDDAVAEHEKEYWRGG
jgi:hypothetical protein